MPNKRLPMKPWAPPRDVQANRWCQTPDNPQDACAPARSHRSYIRKTLWRKYPSPEKHNPFAIPFDIGDKLFDMYGKVCSVTYISEDHLKPTYKIIFNDKSEVICDEDHLWELYDYKNDRNKLTTVDTKFMVREGIHLYNSKIEKRFVVPVCKPINLPERNDL